MLEAEVLDRVVWIKAQFDGGGSYLGTGFLLDSTTVLTARHVLENEDGTAFADRIRVLPRGASGAEEEPDGHEAKLLWDWIDPEDGKPLLDAALLSVPEVKGVCRFRNLVRSMSDFSTWKLIGFVGSTTDFSEVREPTSVQGTFEIANLDRAEIPLRFDGNPPVPGEGSASWAGASGGPIFVRDGVKTGWLCGILAEAKGDFGDRLQAVSMAAILAAPGFRDHLGISDADQEEDSDRWALVWQTAQILRDDPALAANLMALDADYKSAAARSLTALVDEVLAKADLGPLMKSLLDIKVRRKLAGRGLENLQKLAKNLASLLGYKEADKAGSIQLQERVWLFDTSNESYAEIISGGYRGREPEFETREGDYPRPKYHLALSQLDAGISPRGWQEDQIQELFTKIIHKDFAKPPLVRSQQLERLQGHLQGLEDANTAVELATIIQQALEIRDINKRRPWRLVLWAEDERERKALKPLIKLFDDHLPSLEIAVLKRGRLIDSVREEGPLLALWAILGLWDPDQSEGEN